VFRAIPDDRSARLLAEQALPQRRSLRLCHSVGRWSRLCLFHIGPPLRDKPTFRALAEVARRIIWGTPLQLIGGLGAVFPDRSLRENSVSL